MVAVLATLAVFVCGGLVLVALWVVPGERAPQDVSAARQPQESPNRVSQLRDKAPGPVAAQGRGEGSTPARRARGGVEAAGP